MCWNRCPVVSKTGTRQNDCWSSTSSRPADCCDRVVRLRSEYNFGLEKDLVSIVRAALNLLSYLIWRAKVSIQSVMAKSLYAAPTWLLIGKLGLVKRAFSARSRGYCNNFDKSSVPSASNFLPIRRRILGVPCVFDQSSHGS